MCVIVIVSLWVRFDESFLVSVCILMTPCQPSCRKCGVIFRPLGLINLQPDFVQRLTRCPPLAPEEIHLRAAARMPYWTRDMLIAAGPRQVRPGQARPAVTIVETAVALSSQDVQLPAYLPSPRFYKSLFSCCCCLFVSCLPSEFCIFQNHVFVFFFDVFFFKKKLFNGNARLRYLENT